MILLCTSELKFGRVCAARIARDWGAGDIFRDTQFRGNHGQLSSSGRVLLEDYMPNAGFPNAHEMVLTFMRNYHESLWFISQKRKVLDTVGLCHYYPARFEIRPFD